MPKIIDVELLDRLRVRALDTPRLRMNYNLHPNLDAPIHRFCNALEPGTYIPPHRHTGEHRWEINTILRGHVAVLILDDAGCVVKRVELAPGGAQVAIEIPGGTWHTLTSLASGSVILEVKQGPYIKVEGADFAPWAPQENDPISFKMEHWLRTANAGDRVPIF